MGSGKCRSWVAYVVPPVLFALLVSYNFFMSVLGVVVKIRMEGGRRLCIHVNSVDARRRAWADTRLVREMVWVRGKMSCMQWESFLSGVIETCTGAMGR